MKTRDSKKNVSTFFNLKNMLLCNFLQKTNFFGIVDNTEYVIAPTLPPFLIISKLTRQYFRNTNRESGTK